MANPVIVQKASKGTSSTSTTLAFPGATVQGNLLIAVIRGNAISSTHSVSDPVNGAWTQLDFDTCAINANNLAASFWYVQNALPVPAADVVTLGATGVTVLEVAIGEYNSGIANFILNLDAHNVAAATIAGAPASGNCTTNFANDLLIGWQGNAQGNTITAGLIGGSTALLQIDQANVVAFEDGNQANNTAGLNSATFTGSQNNWVAGIVAFKLVPLSFVQATGNTNTSLGTVTAVFASNVTKGNLLVVLADSNHATTPASSFAISDTLNNTWIPVWVTPQNPSGGTIVKFIQGWIAISKSSGADTITNVTNQTNFGTNNLFAAEFSGFTSAKVDQMLAAATGFSSAVDPLSFNTLFASEIIFVFGFSNPAVGTPWTGVAVNSPFVYAAPVGTTNGIFCAYAIAPTAGTYNFGGTFAGAGAGGNTNISGGFSVAPASSPGSLMLLGCGT